MLKLFISFYKPHKKIFILDMLAAFLISMCDLSFPIITRYILNVYIPNKELNIVFVFCFILLIIYLIKMLLGYFVQYYGHVMGVGMQADMRTRIFEHLQKLPISYFDNKETGSIMSCIVNDLMDISELAHHGPEDLFISIVMIIGSFIYLCTISFPLTLIIFAFIPLIVIFSLFMRKHMNKAFAKSREEVSRINATIENSISGIRVARAFSNATYEEAKFQNSNSGFVVAKSQAYKSMGVYFSGNTFLIDFLNVVVLVSGGYFTYMGYIDYVDLLTFMLFINLFFNPIKKLVNFMEQFQNGITGFERFVTIINEEVEKNKIDGIIIDKLDGEITFNNVNFSYENNIEILSNINITIKPNMKLALVGDSGGGKSTICSLINRFYDVSDGEILLDGVNVNDYDINSLRSNIGVVSQDVFLFNSTIRNNILYGKLEASDEELIEACKKANLYEFIQSLDEGFDTLVGERGVKLSGGQKQRIAIARVFLKDPKVLILDEATSALDNITEKAIQSSLEELSKNKTCIIVAHRLSTIKNANQIAFVSEKEIKELGTHQELINLNGLYKELYDNSFVE